MKPIRLSQHASEQCIARGATLAEVSEAIYNGSRQPAKLGRYKYQAIFQYNDTWQGKFYALKKVNPIVMETDSEFIVITVYTFYF
jgi:hypothetical protein